MEAAGNWKQKALGLIGLALVVVSAAGLWLYSFLTAMTPPPLHPNPQDVPSVQQATPLQKWTDAVEKGRQHARAGLVEQNLPGLSVAVGADGDIVWAEGFGWADFENRVPVARRMRFRIGARLRGDFVRVLPRWPIRSTHRPPHSHISWG